MAAKKDQPANQQFLNTNYTLEIEGVQMGVFDRVSGGDLEVDVIQHQVVFENGGFASLQIPGPAKNQPVTLEGGYGKSAGLYQWFMQVCGGDIFAARKNATISLNTFVDGKYQPVIQWHMINVWPSKLTGFDFGQETTSRARFSITLVCESIEREDLF
ncbi:MAG: phage tail protein [Chloroflexi bacterium]|jgi:phage tail-like protein|nr:phage tail protein [Anaerolineaceae bacterium]NMB88205.1 phage tail protein [Chloroflexota bacterium]